MLNANQIKKTILLRLKKWFYYLTDIFTNHCLIYVELIQIWGHMQKLFWCQIIPLFFHPILEKKFWALLQDFILNKKNCLIYQSYAKISLILIVIFRE